ncbi:YeeE/YedE family protein [Sphingobium yanoikuyae]|uniref:YeeE/YedE family protein n=1 Tax=Sphingobium yanoikuyae TaxID=13690 RepID=UPI0028A7971E|nr:YeeE/YedE family protein [Sphingobium yanoikuyae]
MRMLIALAAGLLFGAGLAISGLADPSRVTAFLDLFGAWDPTLAFVMAGAILPMAVAWQVQRRARRALSGDAFCVPETTRLDARLAIGALLFGVGWGLTGICPGPAVANLGLAPVAVLPFLIAMAGGMLLHRLWASRPPSSKAGN